MDIIIKFIFQLFVVLFFFMFNACGEKKDDPNENDEITRINVMMEELIPDLSWNEWYENNSGFNSDPESFSAYVTLPVKADLYFALSSARITDGEGALLGRYDGISLEALAALNEEGIHEMVFDDKIGCIHIAGTDPCCGDDWSAGNHYTYMLQDKNLIKFRSSEYGLKNVWHTWGLWIDINQTIYAAVSSHDGSFLRKRSVWRKIYDRLLGNPCQYGITCFGQIFKSMDNGKQWIHCSNLGHFRAYDIVGLNDRLYAIYSDKPHTPCKLAVSHDSGNSWYSFSDHQLQPGHLIPHNNKLYSVSYSGTSIYVITVDSIKQIVLPTGTKAVAGFNILTNVETYLYIICHYRNENYCILRTQNFRDWQQLVSTKYKLVSIAYWEKRNLLVLGACGTKKILLKVDLHPGNAQF